MSVVSKKLQSFLDQHHICYETVPHVTDFTALETSEHTHTPGRSFAKAVLVTVPTGPHSDALVMLVLPADHRVDLVDVQRRLRSGRVSLAPESRIARLLRDCDRGAIPPFGNLYGLRVLVCPSLLDEETITFNAGSHEMAIRVSTSDYLRLVRPERLEFSHHV